LSEGPVEPRKIAVTAYTVHFSTGQKPEPGQAATNSFGLHGQGRLLVDEEHLTFDGPRNGHSWGGPPRMNRADVANVEHNEQSGAFLLRSRSSDDFVIFWVTSPEDARQIREFLPLGHTPEFIAEQKLYEHYEATMDAIGKRAPVTPTVIALNAAMFIICMIAGGGFLRMDSQVLISLGSNYGPLTWGGEEWRLLSSAFLHGGILHIGLNMVALYQGGWLVERLYGSTRFALIYLLSALAGSVASGWWEPVRNSVGASGAIFGVFGAMLAFFALRRADFPHRLWKGTATNALWFCAISLGIGFASPVIDNTAHIGGLLGGFIAGLLLARPFNAEARAEPKPLQLVIAALAVLVPLALMARPLLDTSSNRSVELRFTQTVERFAAEEARLIDRQEQLLNVRPNVRVNRLELAKALRNEVLLPWREAARPILELPSVEDADSRVARLQAAFVKYVKARDRALDLRVQSLDTGDAAIGDLAMAQESRVGELVKEIGALLRDGT
jgi:rhomboid protease GluP